jgi:acetyl esterase
VFTAGYDPLRDDGKEYADRLREAGVPVTYRNYEGMIHGLFWMSGVVDQARTVMDEVGEQVRAALGGSAADSAAGSASAVLTPAD